MLKRIIGHLSILSLGAIITAVVLLSIDNARRAVMNYLSLHSSSPVVLILGDSHLARFDSWPDIWSLKPWQIRNIAVDGYQARQVYSMYRDQVSSDDHCVLVVMAGINRTKKDMPNDAADAIDKLVRIAKKRDKKLVILEVMYTERPNDSAYVEELNMQLRTIAEINNTMFVSVNHKLSGKKKLLSQFSSDELHLNSVGYSALMAEIREQTLQFISTELKQCRG